MIEENSYIWYTDADVLCIPTSNVIDLNGSLIMDDGIAYQAKETDINLPYYFASHIVNHGNSPCLFMRDSKPHFCSFPVRFGANIKPDLELIIQSVKLMLNIVNRLPFKKIAMPRPGCGKGELDWESEVKPAIERFLDDRFTVYDIGNL